MLDPEYLLERRCHIIAHARRAHWRASGPLQSCLPTPRARTPSRAAATSATPAGPPRAVRSGGAASGERERESAHKAPRKPASPPAAHRVGASDGHGAACEPPPTALKITWWKPISPVQRFQRPRPSLHKDSPARASNQVSAAASSPDDAERYGAASARLRDATGKIRVTVFWQQRCRRATGAWQERRRQAFAGRPLAIFGLPKIRHKPAGSFHRPTASLVASLSAGSAGRRSGSAATNGVKGQLLMDALTQRRRSERQTGEPYSKYAMLAATAVSALTVSQAASALPRLADQLPAWWQPAKPQLDAVHSAAERFEREQTKLDSVAERMRISVLTPRRESFALQQPTHPASSHPPNSQLPSQPMAADSAAAAEPLALLYAESPSQMQPTSASDDPAQSTTRGTRKPGRTKGAAVGEWTSPRAEAALRRTIFNKFIHRYVGPEVLEVEDESSSLEWTRPASWRGQSASSGQSSHVPSPSSPASLSSSRAGHGSSARDVSGASGGSGSAGANGGRSMDGHSGGGGASGGSGDEGSSGAGALGKGGTSVGDGSAGRGACGAAAGGNVSEAISGGAAARRGNLRDRRAQKNGGVEGVGGDGRYASVGLGSVANGSSVSGGSSSDVSNGGHACVCGGGGDHGSVGGVSSDLNNSGDADAAGSDDQDQLEALMAEGMSELEALVAMEALAEQAEADAAFLRGDRDWVGDIWKPRAAESGSGDVFDSEIVYRTRFDREWNEQLDLLDTSRSGGAQALDELRDVMWDCDDLMLVLFDYCARAACTARTRAQLRWKHCVEWFRKHCLLLFVATSSC